MSTLRSRGPTRKRLAGFRRFLAAQQWMWDRHLAELRPWEQEAELRWIRNPLTGHWELRGGVLPSTKP